MSALLSLAKTVKGRIQENVDSRKGRNQSCLVLAFPPGASFIQPLADESKCRRAAKASCHFVSPVQLRIVGDVLRCKSPELIAREVLMHQIAYNLVRSLMQRSAHLHDVPLPRISFKGTLDTLPHWSVLIAAAGRTPRQQARLIDQMLVLIAADLVPERPDRSEPRAKNYKLMTRPRAQIGHVSRRNRPKAKQPKPSLS